MTRNPTVAARLLCLGVLVLVAPYAGAQNLLTNPSFDNDGAGWTPANSDVEAVYRADVGSALAGGSGPGALEIRYSFSNGSGSGVWQEATVIEGAEYDLAVSAYAPSAVDAVTGDAVYTEAR